MTVFSKLTPSHFVIFGSTLLCTSITSLYFFYRKHNPPQTDKSKRWHELVSYTTISFSANLLLASLVVLFKKSKMTPNSLLLSLAVTVASTSIPGVVASLIDRKSEEIIWPTISKNKWVWSGAATIVALSGLNVLVNLAFQGVRFAKSFKNNVVRVVMKKLNAPAAISNPKVLNKSTKDFIFQVAQYAVVIRTPFSLVMEYGQERGWRDFMLCRLKELGFGFWQSSFIVGSIWGLWSFPAVLLGQYFPSNPYLGIIWIFVGRCLLSPIIQFFTEKANSKPIAATAAVMNGVLQTVMNPSKLLVDGGSDLKCGLFGVSGWITLLAANGLLFTYQVIEKMFKEEQSEDKNVEKEEKDTNVEKDEKDSNVEKKEEDTNVENKAKRISDDNSHEICETIQDDA